MMPLYLLRFKLSVVLCEISSQLLQKIFSENLEKVCFLNGYFEARRRTKTLQIVLKAVQ